MLCDPRLDLDVRDGHQRSLEEVQRWFSLFHVEYNCSKQIICKTFSLVAEQQFPTFETIHELLRDQRTKFSMLAGQVTLVPMFVSLLSI